MRLVTRLDFDGLICALLLKEKKIITDCKFAHPKDLQDGLVEIDANDVLANVPYVPGCGMWFDHHTSEQQRYGKKIDVPGDSRPLLSCARVIWEYYGGHDSFPPAFDEMMQAVDKVDSGQLDIEDIETPRGWVLLGLLTDPRTGLGRYRHFRINNEELARNIIEYCRSMDVHEILELSDVKERLVVYEQDKEAFRQMIQDNSKVYGKLVVTDLRHVPNIYVGNRFVLYTIYPNCNISMQIMWGLNKKRVVITLGYSILNRTCKLDVGKLMLAFGGGGHPQVGTCQVDADRAEETVARIVEAVEIADNQF